MKKFYFLTLALICAIVANAASIPSGTKLYLTPNSNWKVDNARFAAYFFGDGEAWASMSAVDGETDLYEVTTPGTGKNYTNVIFCRMNPSATANNWNNKWNQTADLTYDGTNNWYTVKSGTWDNGGGTWSFYGETEDVLLTITTTPSSVYVGDVVTINVEVKNQPEGSTIQIDVNGDVTTGTTTTWTAAEAGTYTVKATCMNGTEELASVETSITVYKKNSVYITGSFTNPAWDPGAAEEFTYVEDQDHYYYFVSSTSAVQFKLSRTQGTWDDFNGQAIYANMTAADTEYSYSEATTDMNLPAGEWYIIVNLTTKKIQYTADDKLTSVEETLVDENAPVEYYNLQGVKVANPENGLFIKKQGSKATKVVL